MSLKSEKLDLGKTASICTILALFVAIFAVGYNIWHDHQNSTPILGSQPAHRATAAPVSPIHQVPSSRSQSLSASKTTTNTKDGAEMVWIPAGDFIMGSDEDPPALSTLKPRRTFFLDGYWMYKTPVTVAQYRKFCHAANHSMPNPPSWGWIDDHPMVNVSLKDALAYAKWAGAKVPTEA